MAELKTDIKAEDTKTKDATEQEKTEQTEQPIVLQAIYLKDFSFESPNSPGVFNAKWAPQIDLQLSHKHLVVQEDFYETVLHLEINCKQDEKHAFVIEIQQAGLFQIRGVPQEQIEQVLCTFCADLLFPYARSTIDNILLHGGFPPLKLAPINFVQVYQESLAKKKQNEPADQHA